MRMIIAYFININVLLTENIWGGIKRMCAQSNYACNPFYRISALEQTVYKSKTTLLPALIFIIIAAILGGCSPAPKKYCPPERTSWAPNGARTVPSLNEILGNPVEFWRTMHADTLNSGEVAIAAAPVFEAGWIAEPNMFIPEGPTFDRSGNIYFSPIWQDVLLVSLNSDNGSRRWAIEGHSYGAGAPLILEDPDHLNEQIIYAAIYDRAIAVRPDGSFVWDQPTGLAVTPDLTPTDTHIYGLNYDQTTDAIIGLSGDGHVVALDRKNGSQLLSTPFIVPGEKSPANTSITIPSSLLKRMDDALAPFIGSTTGELGYSPSQLLINVALGNELKVANYFSVDPHTGRIWVVATAPDAEDGSLDGVSAYGALYCLKLIPVGRGLYTIEEKFHTSFAGGSATTPAFSADGARVYVGDNFGKLIAVDASDGSKIWEVNLSKQLFAAPCIASDKNEIYAVTTEAVIKVIDEGANGEEIWRSKLDMYPEILGLKNQVMLSAAVCANGIAFHAGTCMIINGKLPVPFALGVGLLDRETGQVRYFAQGHEESISMTPIGPDGCVYMAHSPVRRAIAVALFGRLVPPLSGGIQKYAAKRLDLLIRDAVHAAADRAKNVSDHAGSFSESVKEIEMKQIGLLIDQCRRASTQTIADGDLSHQQWTEIDGYLTGAESALLSTPPDFAAVHLNLQLADNLLPDR